MRIIKAATVLLIIVCSALSSAHAQLGNLDWVKGREERQVREDAPLLISLDLCAGRLRTTIKEKWHYWYPRSDYSDDAVSISLALSAKYRVVGTPLGESSMFDVSVLGSLGVIAAHGDLDDLRDLGFIGYIAPEIGFRVTANSMVIRPFLSIGPGFVIDDHGEDKFDLVWMPRGGIEMYQKGKRWSFSVGAKYYSRNLHEDEWFSQSQRVYLGFLGIGLRI